MHKANILWKKISHMSAKVILGTGVRRSLLSVFYNFLLHSFKNVCTRICVYYFCSRITDLYDNKSRNI